MSENAENPAAITPSEKAVQFINAEVLSPPAQGDISFVKPYAEQVVVMALEDARSFLQGAEQILLVFIARALEELLSGGAATTDDTVLDAEPLAGAQPKNAKQSNRASSGTGPDAATLAAAERMLQILPQFHASIADTALKFKGDK